MSETFEDLLELHWPPERKHPYAVTVVPSRYGGTYEGGGKWLAFPCRPHVLSHEAAEGWESGDNACDEWWRKNGHLPIGRGDTPDAALEDMFQRFGDRTR